MNRDDSLSQMIAGWNQEEPGSKTDLRYIDSGNLEVLESLAVDLENERDQLNTDAAVFRSALEHIKHQFDEGWDGRDTITLDSSIYEIAEKALASDAGKALVDRVNTAEALLEPLLPENHNAWATLSMVQIFDMEPVKTRLEAYRQARSGN